MVAASIALYAAMLAAISALAVHAGDRILVALTAPAPAVVGTATRLPPEAATQRHVEIVSGAKVLAGDDWTDMIRSENFWKRQKQGSQSNGSRQDKMSVGAPSWVYAPTPTEPQRRVRSDDGTVPDARRRRSAPASGSYRTVCVRLCDGFYWPINYGTDSDDLDTDARTCERSCASPTRLFMHPVDGDIEDLIDQKGQPYAKLKTAFLFRKVYDESCKCKPHAWEDVAQERHRIYALEARAKKGDRTVVAEIKDLRQKQTQALAAARKQPQGAAAVRAAAAKAAEQGRLTAAAAVAVPPAVAPPAEADQSMDPEVAAMLAAVTVPPPVLPPAVAVTAATSTVAAADETDAEPPVPKVRQAAAPRPGVMRLGRSDQPTRSSRPVVGTTSRTANEWTNRVFNTN